MSASDVITDFEYEKKYERELGLAGAYLPVKGIRGLGWAGWRELPAADVVKDMIEWHNGFIKEHIGEPFYLLFHQMIEKGELSLDELRVYFSKYYGFVDNMFPWEGLVTVRLQELSQLDETDPEGVREIRDLFRTHFYEEIGHEELLADFCEQALKLNRVKDVYLPNLAKEEGYLKTSRDLFKMIYGERHFTEAAVLMFAERDLPKSMRRTRLGLSKKYGFADRDLNYFDIHSYIDIYHERYGAYIIAKYATSKELENNVKNLFQQIITTRYESEKQQFDLFRASRR